MYNTFGRAPKDWQLIHTEHFNSADYEVYEDSNKQHWYVPIVTEQCDECHGSGHEEDDEREPCWVCDGDMWVNIRIPEQALSEEEYESVKRQRKWLEKRYGYIPQHIQDYWVAQS